MAMPPQSAYSTARAFEAVDEPRRARRRDRTRAKVYAPSISRSAPSRPSERFVQLVRVLAAGLGEVGLAAAFAADDRGELADERVGLDAVEEVFRDRGQQRDLAVGGAAEDDHAALDLRAELVGEVAEIAAGEVVDAARDQLDAVDVDCDVVRRRRRRRRRSRRAPSAACSSFSSCFCFSCSERT